MGLAHVLRELAGLMEQGSVWAAAMHAFLLELYRRERPLRGETALEFQRLSRQMLSLAE
jgi:hypothetical protein